ncbi:ash family protein [Mannheimia sp. HC-2023]|uniref:ash family protein n=1 Tax=Mannheimia indoligenes TaxID=3103145 RepID=UPI002FE56376
MNLNQEYYKQCEIFSQEKSFTSGQIFNKFHNVVAKSTAEPENSNYLHTANSSTPLNRAFFVRSTRTPKEYPELHESREYQFTPNEFNQLNFERVKSLSMVACNGKGFALCCVPYVAVSQPVTRYRPKPENFRAVTSSKFHTELSAMIYLFKAVSRLDLRKTQKPFTSFPHYTLKVKADSVEQAQAKISRLFAVLSVSTMAEGVQYV